MKRLALLSFALAAAFTTLSAQAVVVNASFTGQVQSQTGTGFAPNTPISGSFAYDTASASFVSYVVGGESVATGYTSAASLTPDGYTALYTAQLSPVQSGVSVNSTFSLDLEGVQPWTGSSAISLLTDTAQLASNLDLQDSSFRFYTANADGTSVRTVVAELTGVSAVVAAVPEPSTTALLSLGLGALALIGGRRRR